MQRAGALSGISGAVGGAALGAGVAPGGALGAPVDAVEVDETATRVQEVFYRFLTSYRLNNEAEGNEAEAAAAGDTPPHYVALLDQMIEEESTTLYINFEHVVEYEQVLAEFIESQYLRFEPFLKRALQQVITDRYPIEITQLEEGISRIYWLSFHGLGAVHKVRQLLTSRIGALSTISGTVTRTSDVRPELLYGSFTCLSCRHEERDVPQQFKFTEPLMCKNALCAGQKTQWQLNVEESRFVDWQRVRVQENPDEIPSGAMPRSLDVILRHEQVEKAKAGDKCLFTGSLIVVPDVSKYSATLGATLKTAGGSGSGSGSGFSGGGVKGLKGLGVRELTYKMAFLAVFVQPADAKSGSLVRDESDEAVVETFSQEEREEIYQMKQTPDLYSKMVSSIAPRVFGHEEIKRGLLLMLFGGVHKSTMEGISLRGDLNVCIVGDPSTAKSQFLKYTQEFLPRAIYTSGKSSSAAGLTATVVKDPDTREFNIEAGALMLADNGICCIAAGSPVLLSSGLAVPIERVLPKGRSGSSQLLAPLAVSGGARSAQCTARLDNGERECVQLTFEDGRRLLCTPDHRLLMADGTWMAAERIALGCSRVTFAAIEAPVDSPSAVEASFALQAGEVSLHMKCPAERAKALAFARLSGFTWSNAADPKDVDVTRLKHNTRLDAESIQCDLSLLGRGSRTLSAAVSTFLSTAHEVLLLDSTPVSFVREFLGGFCGANGVSLNLVKSSTSDKLPLKVVLAAAAASPLKQFESQFDLLRALLLRRFGIGCQLRRRQRRQRRHSSLTTIQLHLADSLGFAERVGVRHCKRKQLRLAAASVWNRRAGLLRDEILCCSETNMQEYFASIGADGWWDSKVPVLARDASVLPTLALQLLERRVVGPRHVFDLTVPGPTSFFANGVAVHNCIDEFDKMDVKDQVAIHEAMEQQTISIAKAGIHATLNARTSILAAANPISGRYDRSKTLKQNLSIGAALMSRFDLFFIVLDESDPVIDHSIAQHIVHLHQTRGRAERPYFSKDMLQRYIKFARSVKPRLTPESAELFVDYYRRLRGNDAVGSGKTAYRITVRQLESMIRLAEALARLHLSDEVLPRYVDEAARLLRKSIIHVESDSVSLDNVAATAAAAPVVAPASPLNLDHSGEKRSSASSAPPPDAAEEEDDDSLLATSIRPAPSSVASQVPDEGPVEDVSSTKPAQSLKLSYEQYNEMSNMIVNFLRRTEKIEDEGLRQQAIVDWYTEQIKGEVESADELIYRARLLRATLQKMLRDDHRLVLASPAPDGGEGINDDERVLKVHPNFSID